MRNHATLHDVVVIGGQSYDVLAVFGHVQKFAAILVNVGYLKMIVRCRKHHTTSCDVEAHRTKVVQWSCDDVVRLHLGS